MNSEASAQNGNEGLGEASKPSYSSNAPNRNRGRWICLVCGHVYDPAQGDPDSGIAPGTPFEDLPADWLCPGCGARKSAFEPYPDDAPGV